MSRPTHARIDLDALRHNLGLARSLAGTARVLAVVKANAYGHGAVPVARAIAEQVDALGIACLEEALELRDSGIRAPILILEGLFSPDEIPLVDRHGLALVVHSAEQLAWVLSARPRRRLHCWLKADTGMHRLGFDRAGFQAAYASLRRAPQVADLVLMTHLARADEPTHGATPLQMERFAGLCAGLGDPRSLANSAALLAWPQSRWDWVRPGILLYGASPLVAPHEAADLLRPVMRLESTLIAVRELSAGEPIGYGGRFVCPGTMRVGVVALGYADGYPRHAPDGTPVAVRGQLTRLIGRVSMDMLTVDLTGMSEARVGDPVELWGDRVSAAAVAEASATIPYHLFTGVGARVPRRYQG